MAQRGRPRKPSHAAKAEGIEIRVTATEKQAFREAADIAGLGLSTWVRERLRRAAIKELEEAGRIAAFLDRAMQE